jgi:hypothetical protein
MRGQFKRIRLLLSPLVVSPEGRPALASRRRGSSLRLIFAVFALFAFLDRLLLRPPPQKRPDSHDQHQPAKHQPTQIAGWC